MSKLGAIGRGLYSLVALLVNVVLRVGLHVALVAGVGVSVHEAYKFSKSSGVLQRKEVLDVIYWRDPKKSAIVLSLALLALFILAKYPLLTVVTYSLLLALGAAAGFRVFKKIEAQIKKTDAEHPFSEILATDLSLPQEKVHAQADVFVEHATLAANKLKKLVFVESPFESLKFGLVLWSLTYIASWFSGFTLAILGLVGVFSVPKVYESNQEAIDPHLATISGHLKNVQNLIDEKLPFLRSAPVAAEEKKDQ
uniref:Reticulon-like protein n=1 Tax=Caenorhabditis japonica TaxID=281687 RepID=A0A8R1I107_CAEJA